jgi:adenine-specific DNA-methyltransferase
MVDPIIKQKTRNVREYCAFYTESEPILEYMVAKLGSLEGTRIFEPCAGDGAFIEKILEKNLSTQLNLLAFDLNTEAIHNLGLKFSDDGRILLKNTDTLLDTELDEFLLLDKKFSRIIGNPPYGAWQDQEKRKLLKAKYGGYVRETYSLFMRRCLNMLEDEGRMVFIVPDTFLALHMHEGMRKNILSKFTIEELLLMPSNFFPGVNFGYANLCIITIVAKTPSNDSKTRIVKVTSNVEVLKELANDSYKKADSDVIIFQNTILGNVGSSFLISTDSDVSDLINESTVNLGSLADCVTGFYSGNNAENIYQISEFATSDTNPIDLSEIEMNPSLQSEILLGSTTKRYIPIYMGGKAIVDKKIEKCINWSPADISKFKSDNKARFQNSSYYFREGVGIPMVKSKKLKAFKIDKQLFDQSIVGIFPHDPRHLNFLLVFLNSDLCSRIINTINHTANNSANYVKKIPVPLTKDIIHEADLIVSRFIKSNNTDQFLDDANELFEGVRGAFNVSGNTASSLNT